MKEANKVFKNSLDRFPPTIPAAIPPPTSLIPPGFKINSRGIDRFDLVRSMATSLRVVQVLIS
mgnify:CR=1 FL=1